MRTLTAILALLGTFAACLFIPMTGLTFLFVLGEMSANLIVAYFANERRNRNFYRWLAISVIIGPVFGFALAACSRTLPEV